MSGRCRPWWLPHAVAAAVILPAAGAIGLSLYSVHLSDGWSAPPQDAPGFALCGLFGMNSFAVLVIALAGRAWYRRDAEVYAALAAGCGLGVAGLTLSLAEAGAVALGLHQGRVPAGVVAGVGGAWAYLVALGWGHWQLSRAGAPPGPPE